MEVKRNDIFRADGPISKAVPDFLRRCGRLGLDRQQNTINTLQPALYGPVFFMPGSYAGLFLCQKQENAVKRI